MNGAMWWGHSDEPDHFGGFNSDEEMLAGSEVDVTNSVSYVMREFDKTGVMNSKFLTEDENTYLTENISSLVIYPAKTDPIKCGSEIVVLHKK